MSVEAKVVVMTACSLNYMSQAMSLGDSLKQTNPNCRYVIGVVDRLNPGETYDVPYEVLWIDDTDFNAEEAAARYNIVELVTAAKPFMMRHLMASLNPGDLLIYLDPDVLVFGDLLRIEAAMGGAEIGLTPHFLEPIEDALLPSEQHIARTGVFNLGFLSLTKGEHSLRLLNWWAARLQNYCYIDFKKGLFVDQAWMNLVPAYFESHRIIRDAGMNAAHWNLHERKISRGSGGQWLANDDPLTFYHFSHYSPKNPQRIASHHTRIDLRADAELMALYEVYLAGLMLHNYFERMKTPCAFHCQPLGVNRKKATVQYINEVLPGRLRQIAADFYKSVLKGRV